MRFFFSSLFAHAALLRFEYSLVANARASAIRFSFGAILFTSSVRAGFATVAEDAIEKRVSLDESFDLDNPSVFMFTVSGDSMVNAGIFDGDRVIVKKTPYAKDGDIVLAYIDNGYTLKTYRQKNGKVWLQPENPEYPVIEPRETLLIFGVATGITRQL